MVKHKMDHLSCFIPAMLALGAHSGAVTGAKATKYLQVAEELTHTCWQMYHQMPSGGPPLSLLIQRCSPDTVELKPYGAHMKPHEGSGPSCTPEEKHGAVAANR